MKRSKRLREIDKMLNPQKVYPLQEAVEVLKNCSPIKFDQSVEVALQTGIDPQKSDQQLRGVLFLPHGIGKKLIIVVFAKGDKQREALEAGADFVGAEELLEKVKGGWLDFDVVIATPDMMREVGKLGKIFSPRNLMPTPKSGGVTQDVTKAIREVQSGRRGFKNDKYGVVSGVVGKLSFSLECLVENIKAFLSAIAKVKPPSSKGQYFRSCFISSTMGPGLKIDLSEIIGA